MSDARCDEIFPQQFPAVLRATLTDGTRHEVRVDMNRGGPGNPLTSDELSAKFRINAHRKLNDDAAAHVADAAFALPNGGAVQTLMDLVR